MGGSKIYRNGGGTCLFNFSQGEILVFKKNLVQRRVM
jgi:hypothetical protein